MWLVLMGSWAGMTQRSNTSIDVYVMFTAGPTLVDKVELRVSWRRRVNFSRARGRTFQYGQSSARLIKERICIQSGDFASNCGK